ncbi:MAG: MBL fold metallo-hydrolase [Eubacteriaceae bacterium]
MKIFHLHHSGFLIQFEDKTLIFDCCTAIPSIFLRKGIPHYFFVTHGHGDHFDLKSINIDKEFLPTYIYSDDISSFPLPSHYSIEPYQRMYLGGMDIRTFGSTDLGVSFYIIVNDHRIFHAGDLNWWYWDPALKPQIDLRQEEIDFKREISLFSNLPMEFVFFPVDPRLGDTFYKAGKYFIEIFHPKVFIPMHFRNDFSIIQKFKTIIGPTDTIIPDFHSRNMAPEGLELDES